MESEECGFETPSAEAPREIADIHDVDRERKRLTIRTAIAQIARVAYSTVQEARLPRGPSENPPAPERATAAGEYLGPGSRPSGWTARTASRKEGVMNPWNFLRRRAAPPAAPETPPAPTMSGADYQAALVEGVIAGDPRRREIHARICEAIAAIPDVHGREHQQTHAIRWLKTVTMFPDGPGDLVDIAAAPFYAEALKARGWNVFPVEILSLDYERDPLPHADEQFGAALLGEVIEHFVLDPLFCLNEINRILKPGGVFIVTTPNIASWFAIYQARDQRHPSRWPVYSVNPEKARNHLHAREYTVAELRLIVEAAGFGEVEVTTLDYGIAPPHAPIAGFDPENRGETIYLSCRKMGPPRYRAIQPIYLETQAFGGCRR
jgi:SAM-dependent methyltransferase